MDLMPHEERPKQRRSRYDEANLRHRTISSFLPLLDKCQTARDLKHLLAPLIVVGLFKDAAALRKVVTLCSISRIARTDWAATFLRHADHPQPFTWNTVIRSYEQNHEPLKAIKLYKEMSCRDVYLDKFTFPFVLRACASVRALKEGEQIHSRVLKGPLSVDLFVQGSLIFMYANCGKMGEAEVAFDAMPHKNLISWNMMISGYVKNGNVDYALKMFDKMPERDLFSWNLMIDGLSRDGKIESARQLFDEMPERDVISWNSMIDGYAKCGNMTSARELFDQVPVKDEVTWGIMLNGYANNDQIMIAHNWFEKMPYKNLITWNCLISGYAKSDNITVAQKLFESMPNRNLTSWNAMLDAFAKHGNLDLAFQLFNAMPIKDVVSWNILVDAHARFGQVEAARKLFDDMPYKDVVSWNALIAAYKENGLSKEAIGLFFDMHLLGETLDCSTLAIVLSAIADLGLIVQGRWLHAYADRNKFPLDGVIGVALIDMYSKCGHADIARKIFDGIHVKSRDHWNAMISGLAFHGCGYSVVSLFEDMERSLVKPDDITFIGLLSACSHAGLVFEGHQYFRLMSLKYGLTPKIQHYGCMVDLLSRAGFLEAAVVLVNSMPMKPNDIVWRALLGASRNRRNIEIAEYAARHLIELVPYDSSSFVLLSNIYVYKGQYENAKDIWKIMKENRVLKNPGCSCIELHGSLHEFSAGDTSHPQFMEIYLLLKDMMTGFESAGYVPDVERSLF